MREKLIELLFECHNECYSISCEECEYCGDRRCLSRWQADHLIANGVMPRMEPPAKRCVAFENENKKMNFGGNYMKPDTIMTFGDAIEAVKDGQRVSRKGWNGKGMFVFLARDADFNTDADMTGIDQPEVPVHDMLVLKTAQNTLQPGWLATQTDMLAEDWFVVE